MKYIFSIVLTLLINISFGSDWKVAMIADEDGFVNIRSGEGIDFDIVGTINTGELFYCEVSQSDWWRIPGDDKRYVHKSRIQIIESLPDSVQQKLFKKILIKQAELVYELKSSFSKYDLDLKRWDKGSDSVEYQTTKNELGYHEVNKYFPALQTLPIYYCRTSDSLIIRTLFETILNQSGTATENPVWAIGKCFQCLPNFTMTQLEQLTEHQKIVLKYEIDSGLRSICENEEELKQLIEILKKE